jgi:hypothetical protein
MFLHSLEDNVEHATNLFGKTHESRNIYDTVYFSE